jgi:hypothetical protein
MVIGTFRLVQNSWPKVLTMARSKLLLLPFLLVGLAACAPNPPPAPKPVASVPQVLPPQHVVNHKPVVKPAQSQAVAGAPTNVVANAQPQTTPIRDAGE